MDPRLAELYGTTQTDDGDLEKAAAAEFAEGLTEEGEMSLDGLTEDDLEALAQEVLSEDGEETEEGADFSEEEQEKLAEADFVGRAMAHAYVAELGEIEKVAKKKPGFLSRVSSGIEKAERKGEKKIVKGAKWALKKGKAGLSAAAKSGPGKFAIKHGKKVGKHLARNRGKYMLGAAGAGGVAAALKSKEASAFETLAEQRAMELIAAGDQGEVTQYDVLADAVEQRAAEILAANGYELQEE